jgi:hypothetical protein
MDLRKYKAKHFVCVDTTFWWIVWVTENGADFVVESGKKIQHTTPVLPLGYLDFFRCGPTQITFLLFFSKKGQWTELPDYWYSPTLPCVKFLYRTANIMST